MKKSHYELEKTTRELTAQIVEMVTDSRKMIQFRYDGFRSNKMAKWNEQTIFIQSTHSFYSDGVNRKLVVSQKTALWLSERFLFSVFIDMLLCHQNALHDIATV